MLSLEHLIEDEWSPHSAAAVVATQDNGKILMIRRRDSGLWGLPAGRWEPGDTNSLGIHSFESTIIRELKEETSLTARRIRLIDFVTPVERRI